ncbi:MAG: PE domain-containing protein [Mycobacteriaceae bacterium]|nr:PE domain-containing protein [Mycobacteriaceae bacterium]
MYQAISGQAAAFHELFVKTLAASGNCYAVTGAADAVAVR